MRFVPVVALALSLIPATLHAQIDLEDSHTQASLRGISTVSSSVAWASGTEGTILRTEDGGHIWQVCAIPPGADKLDFRGVVGFDNKNALAMASGKGPLSAVYKTTDGCRTWNLILANPDPEGFFDTLAFTRDRAAGYLLGDPVGDHFVLYETRDRGDHWLRSAAPDLKIAAPGLGAFAASNSALLAEPLQFGTSGPGGPFLYTADLTCNMETARRAPDSCFRTQMSFSTAELPLAHATSSAGIFSLAHCGTNLVAVGGDYTQPASSTASAAYYDPHLAIWQPAKTQPRGYRSTVAYDPATQTCITAGPSGLDISHDDGLHWSGLSSDTPSTALNWNAISFPFIVGSHGRIGKLHLPSASPRR